MLMWYLSFANLGCVARVHVIRFQLVIQIAMSHSHSPLAQRYGASSADELAPLKQPVLKNQLQHRSVRAFLADPLPSDVLEALVVSAQSAPTSSNLQSWSVIAIQSQEGRTALAALAGNQAHIAQAPLLLVWVADLSRAQRLAQARGQSVEATGYLDTYLTASLDAGPAAQNVVSAAEALGYGTVYIGALRNQAEKVSALLKLPAGAVPVFGLVVGKPDPSVPTAIKPRLPSSVVLHHETYQVPADEAALVQAYDEILLAFQRSQQLPEVAWSESVLQRLKNAESLNGRQHLQAFIQKQGVALE